MLSSIVVVSKALAVDNGNKQDMSLPANFDS
jgi:hypothetical protein